MEQFTLFSDFPSLSSEEQAFYLIKPLLEDLIASNWLDSQFLHLEKRTSYYSILYDDSLIARLHCGKKFYFELPAQRCNGSNVESSKDYTRIELYEPNDILNYSTQILQVTQSILDLPPKEFDCCSRYMACSNQIACVNPDKNLARKCGYRRILKSGKIYYGKNRNIDI